MQKELLDILRRYWNYSTFREGQQDVILSICEGHDTLAVLPTGGGKSICYQLPALYKDGLTIVVSPLISLMKDQILSLKNKNIQAEALMSGQTYRQQDIILDNAVHGKYKLLYVSPERLKTQLFRSRYAKMQISLIAVDEAHCISEWGHDFRPEYRRIAELKEIHPDVPTIAVTATATNQVQDDIIENLQFSKSHKSFKKSPLRKNLSYQVINTEDKPSTLSNILKTKKNQYSLVYVPSRKMTVELQRLLTNYGIRTEAYHGGLNNKLRSQISQEWIDGRISCIVATKAFGMGIDKSNVRRVIHYQIPDTIESYVQEAGRAGRDGDYSECIIFYNPADSLKAKNKLEDIFPEKEFIKEVYKNLCLFFGVGSGLAEDRYYVLNHVKFCQNYNTPLFKTVNAIKILHKAGIINVSEGFFEPSRLKLEEFMVKKLLDEESVSPKLKSFVKLLLRNYEGLFFDFTAIDETLVAQKFQSKRTEVIKGLEWLDQYKYAKYNPSEEGSAIHFSDYRTNSDKIEIPVDVYDRLKEMHIKALNRMIDYIEWESCRQSFISSYFGFRSNEDCGNCDRCTHIKEDVTQDNLEDDIIAAIRSMKPAKLQQLYSSLNKYNPDSINKALQSLESERRISIGMDYTITLL